MRRPKTFPTPPKGEYTEFLYSTYTRALSFEDVYVNFSISRTHARTHARTHIHTHTHRKLWPISALKFGNFVP